MRLRRLCSRAPLFWRGCEMKDLIIGLLAGFLLGLFFVGGALDSSQGRKIKAGAFERDGRAYRITPLDKD